jgi:recombination protein RecA
VGVDQKVVDKSGSWFTYNNLRIGQGREGAKAFLKENPKVVAEIEQKVREKLGLGAANKQE